jgi:hypothetical protein
MGSRESFLEFPKDLTISLASTKCPHTTVEVRHFEYDTRGSSVARVTQLMDFLLKAGLPAEPGSSQPELLLFAHSMGGILCMDALIELFLQGRLAACPPPAPVPVSKKAGDPGSMGNVSSMLGGWWSSPWTGSTTAESMPPAEAEDTVPGNPLDTVYIRGLSTFDSPFFGLAPDVLLHGGRERVVSAGRTVHTAMTFARDIFGMGGAGGASTASAAAASSTSTAVASSTPWGALAVAVSGVAAFAAYSAHPTVKSSVDDFFTTHLGSVKEHIEFLGPLWTVDRMRERLQDWSRLGISKRVAFQGFYLQVGLGAFLAA